MRPLPIVAAGRHGVFTTREALASGWTEGALAHAVARGRLAHPDRGLYAPPVVRTGALGRRERFVIASVAAALATRRGVASHRSAAVLAGSPTWTVPDRASVTVPPRYTGDARRGHLHRATLRELEVLAGDVRRTRSARTIVDVCREAGLDEAVVIGDHALANGRADLDGISDVLQMCRHWPGIGRCDRLLELLDARAESPLESVSRLRLALLGLPAPQPQTEICDVRGYSLGWVDLYWDEFGVAGEIDGKVKFEIDPVESAFRQWRRHTRLDEAGLILVRWGRSDLENMPALAYRLGDAFRRGRLRPAGERRWVARFTDPLAPRTRVV